MSKFVFYNDFSFLKEDKSYLFHILSNIFTSFPVCRFDNEVNSLFCNIPLSYQELQLQNSNSTLVELLDFTACRYTCKNIYVCWSGGIDSSSVLISFLRNTTKKINVLLNEFSIKENPNMYQWLKDKVVFHDCNLSTLNNILYNNDNIVITGTCCDLILDPYDYGFSCSNYSTFLNEFIHKSRCCIAIKDNCDFKYLIDWCNYICTFSPILIKSLKDFLWWMGISMCYNGLKYMWYCTTPTKLVNFFDTDDFINYSVNNHTGNKYQLIKYIRTVYKDYNIQKKIKSGNMLYEYEDNLVLIDEQLRTLVVENNKYNVYPNKNIKLLTKFKKNCYDTLPR